MSLCIREQRNSESVVIGKAALKAGERAVQNSCLDACFHGSYIASCTPNQNEVGFTPPLFFVPGACAIL